MHPWQQEQLHQQQGQQRHQQQPPAAAAAGPPSLPRSSDGSDGLPPMHSQTPRRRKKKGGKGGSLATTSAPHEALLLGGSASTPSSPLRQDGDAPLHPNSRLSVSSAPRSPVKRRSTVSDAGRQPPPHGEEAAVGAEPGGGGGGSGHLALERLASGSASSWAEPGGRSNSDASSAAHNLLAATGMTAFCEPLLRSPSPSQQALLSGRGAAAAPAAQHPAAAAAPRPPSALQPTVSFEPGVLDPPPSLVEFFRAEATPHEKYPTADVLWRQTERDRVYNFLLYVPYQLERIMIFGTLLCLYSFLGFLTVLPLRCLRTLWQLCRHALAARRPTAGSPPPRQAALPTGAQLYDLLCVLLLIGTVWVLALIRPGVIYYWMKDITSEFLKIQVIFTALEILDKILSNFGVDVLEALSSTCTLFMRRSIGLMPLVSDLLVAFLLITAHGSVLMCQAMVFAVSMNSKANAMLALMIATNFVELKGQVYKRTDTNKLWTLACQDIVERFELLLVLSFVVVEDISNSGDWLPAGSTLLVCGRIFLWEVIIDIAKHAVLGKFNDIRPGIYREYMRDLCGDSLDKHSHNTHRLVGFCPMGPAALALRMATTLFTLKGAEGAPAWKLRAAVALLAWGAACCLQVVLGFSLKWAAHLYVRHHSLQAGGKTVPRAINVTPGGVKLIPPAAAAAAAAAAGGGPKGERAAPSPSPVPGGAAAQAQAAGGGRAAGYSESGAAASGAAAAAAAGAAATHGPGLPLLGAAGRLPNGQHLQHGSGGGGGGGRGAGRPKRRASGADGSSRALTGARAAPEMAPTARTTGFSVLSADGLVSRPTAAHLPGGGGGDDHGGGGGGSCGRSPSCTNIAGGGQPAVALAQPRTATG